MSRRLGKVEFADHLRESVVVMERARADAARIIADAEERGRALAKAAEDRGTADGYSKGYARGLVTGKEEALAEGRKEFLERHASLAEAFRAALAAIDQSKLQMELEAGKNLLDFAVSVASQLTFAIGDVHREAACENLRRALSLVTDKTDVTVRCNPKDLESLGVFAESILQSTRSGRRVHLVEDGSVQPGGCVLRSGKSEIDASLETQVREMVSIFLGKRDDA